MVLILRRLRSETQYLPEIRPLTGKSVENMVTEEVRPDITPGTGDWVAAEQAAQRLRQSGYDFDVWRQQRVCDLQHAQGHVLALRRSGSGTRA